MAIAWFLSYTSEGAERMEMKDKRIEKAKKKKNETKRTGQMSDVMIESIHNR